MLGAAAQFKQAPGVQLQSLCMPLIVLIRSLAPVHLIGQPWETMRNLTTDLF